MTKKIYLQTLKCVLCRFILHYLKLVKTHKIQNIKVEHNYIDSEQQQLLFSFTLVSEYSWENQRSN